jgi:hypothetical protein
MSNAPKLPSAHGGVVRGIAGFGRERELNAFQSVTCNSSPFIP